jgi:hypothetical protein
VIWEKGEHLPIAWWGDFRQEEEYKHFLENKFNSSEYPREPGVVSLGFPYEGYLLIIDERCPARYVNCVHGRVDSNGKPLKANVVIEMNPNPFELANNPVKGLQMMLIAKAIRKIEPGDETVLFYGKNYYEHDTDHAVIVEAVIPRDAVTLDEAEYSDDEDANEKEDNSEAKSSAQQRQPSRNNKKVNTERSNNKRLLKEISYSSDTDTDHTEQKRSGPSEKETAKKQQSTSTQSTSKQVKPTTRTKNAPTVTQASESESSQSPPVKTLLFDTQEHSQDDEDRYLCMCSSFDLLYFS